jgi:hypothetical protein
MDIHAEAVFPVAAGEMNRYEIKAASAAWASGLLVFALLAFVAWRRRERFFGGT